MKTREELIKLVQTELSKCFEMGLRQSPTDAENSEFYRPMIDLDIAPKLADKILATQPQVSEEEIKQKMFNKIERFVSDYLKKVGNVHKKDIIEHDLREGISAGLIIADEYAQQKCYPEEFVEWKDNNTEPVYDIDNKIERYYCHFLLFESDDCKTLNDLYDYWLTNIKDK